MNEELKVIITAEIDKLKKNIKDAQGQISGFSKESSSTGDKIKKVFSGIGKAGAEVGKAIGVGMAAAGAAVVGVSKSFVSGVKDIAEYGDNIDKMSQKMGVSAEGYQKWDFVM